MYTTNPLLNSFEHLNGTVRLIHLDPIFSENDEKDDNMGEDKIDRVIVK